MYTLSTAFDFLSSWLAIIRTYHYKYPVSLVSYSYRTISLPIIIPSWGSPWSLNPRNIAWHNIYIHTQTCHTYICVYIYIYIIYHYMIISYNISYIITIPIYASLLMDNNIQDPGSRFIGKIHHISTPWDIQMGFTFPGPAGPASPRPVADEFLWTWDVAAVAPFGFGLSKE